VRLSRVVELVKVRHTKRLPLVDIQKITKPGGVEPPSGDQCVKDIEALSASQTQKSNSSFESG